MANPSIDVTISKKIVTSASWRTHNDEQLLSHAIIRFGVIDFLKRFQLALFIGLIGLAHGHVARTDMDF